MKMKRIIVIMVVGLLIGGGYYGNMLYSRMYGKNVQLKQEKTFIYIPKKKHSFIFPPVPIWMI